MKLILFGALIAFLFAFHPVRADDGCDPARPAARLDVEFDAAVEGMVGSGEWGGAGAGSFPNVIARSSTDSTPTDMPTAQPLARSSPHFVLPTRAPADGCYGRERASGGRRCATGSTGFCEF